MRGQPSRRQWMGLGLAGAVCAGVSAYLWQERQTRQSSPGQAASLAAVEEDFWKLALSKPDGTELRTVTLRGRPLVVNFWATWCAPCVEEMPLLDRFYEQYASKGIQMLGIAADKPEPVKAFLQRLPVHYPIGLAGFAAVQLSKDLGNLAGGLPFTVVFGRDGAIIQRRLGTVRPEDLAAWSQLA